MYDALSGRGRRVAILTTLAAAACVRASAQAPPADRLELLSLVPSDAVAVVTLESARCVPSPDGPSSHDVASQVVVQLSRQLGLLLEGTESIRVWTDVAAGFLQLERYPMALALLDVDVVARPDGGHELARLQAALVLDTQGDHQAIEAQIRHLISTYTNRDHTTLRKLGAAEIGAASFELRDDRLPDWAVITWGPLGGGYGVTLGEGAADRVARCANLPLETLAQTEWMTAAARACRKPGTELRLYADLDRLTAAKPASFTARLRTWLQLLDLPQADRLYTVISRDGRVVESSLFVREPAGDRLLRIADHEFLKTWGYDLIPRDATVFSVVDAKFRTLPLSVWEAYVSSRSPKTAAALRAALTGIESAAGVSLRDDVFSRLGDRIVIHDYPLHALRLPVARTLYIPIDREPQVVAEKLDRFLAATARWLADIDASGRAASSGQEPPPALLRRESDGVWYVHFGLAGPALRVCGNWLVISYSPYAVRENERHLRGTVASIRPPPAD